jgi:hypothetical protein
MDKRLAMLAPTEVFATPEQLRDSTELTRGEKVEILKRWAYDVAESAVALEEGMPEADRDDLQRRVLLALSALADGLDLDFEHAGPTKQHGLPDSRKTR